MTEYKPARRALAAVVRELGRLNIQAAASLEEGFEETLTLHRLGVPPVLRVHLQSTNMIESPFRLCPSGDAQREALATQHQSVGPLDCRRSSPR